MLKCGLDFSGSALELCEHCGEYFSYLDGNARPAQLLGVSNFKRRIPEMELIRSDEGGACSPNSTAAHLC
jgi:hypothetical protein